MLDGAREGPERLLTVGKTMLEGGREAVNNRENSAVGAKKAVNNWRDQGGCL